VVDGEVSAQVVVYPARALGLPVLAEQGEDRRLVRGEPGVKPEDDARLALDLVLVVGVDEEGEQRAVDTRRRLDHPREVALAPLLVEVRQILAARLGVPAEVEVAAVRDPLELGPPERERVLDVDARLRVVRQLVGAVRPETEPGTCDPESDVPLQALVLPVVEPALIVTRTNEELELHLLELACAEEEVSGRDLVAEGAPDLSDAERQLQPRRLEHVPEV